MQSFCSKFDQGEAVYGHSYTASKGDVHWRRGVWIGKFLWSVTRM